jgi:branched-chain amino acid transport system ATP-binding protein
MMRQGEEMQKGGGGKVCLLLREVSRNFGSLAAVSRVNLEILSGERRAIIGPNGAGKTTLFNLIGGQLKPSRGQVLFYGQDVTRMPPYRRAHLGIARTYQITNLFPSLSVLYNVLLAVQALEKTKYVPCMPLKSYGQHYQQAHELLEKVNLLAKKDIRVGQLPYGEQRLVELTLALAAHPKLLLLDEPTSGLPPGESQDLTKVLLDLDPEMTIIIVEHHIDVAFSVAKNVTVLHQGQIMAEGSAEEIKMNPEVQRVYLTGEV